MLIESLTLVFKDKKSCFSEGERSAVQLPPPLPSGSIACILHVNIGFLCANLSLCKQLKCNSQAFRLAKQRDGDHEFDCGKIPSPLSK